MGSGKSAVGAALAGRLGWDLVDTDELVERSRGSTVSEIFETEGEEAFRALELEALRSALDRTGPVVVATGGGVIVGDEARELLAAEPQVAWLVVEPDEAIARIGDRSSRPLLGDDAGRSLRRLNERRRAGYAAVADAVIEVDALSVDEVADRVIAVFEVSS